MIVMTWEGDSANRVQDRLESQGTRRKEPNSQAIAVVETGDAEMRKWSVSFRKNRSA